MMSAARPASRNRMHLEYGLGMDAEGHSSGTFSIC
jgi:hypothetical protein